MPRLKLAPTTWDRPDCKIRQIKEILTKVSAAISGDHGVESVNFGDVEQSLVVGSMIPGNTRIAMDSCRALTTREARAPVAEFLQFSTRRSTESRRFISVAALPIFTQKPCASAWVRTRLKRRKTT